MKPKTIAYSTLDKRVPEGVTVVVRLTHPGASRTPPVKISDHDTLEAAQAASDALTRKRIPHSYLTWWRAPDGRHLHKWPTLMRDKRRNVRVSVPYVQGMTDPMITQFVKKAILSSPDKPDAYLEGTVRVTIDAEANRAELEQGPPDYLVDP